MERVGEKRVEEREKDRWESVVEREKKGVREEGRK